jgi:uridine kinase
MTIHDRIVLENKIMDDIIIRSYLRYPKSTIQDLLKLVYQASFGGGHMIDDSTKSLAFLQEESKHLQTQKNPDELLYEYISHDTVRINLRPYMEYHFDLTYLNDVFVQSANEKHKDETTFKKYLEYLKGLFKNKLINLDYEQALSTISEYEASGVLPLHHSKEYIEAYHPAYRVINKRFITQEMKEKQIERFVTSVQDKDKRLVLAIEGKSCSGKSYLSNYLKTTINASVITTDDFFLTDEQKETQTAIGDYIDYKLLETEVMSKIRNASSVTYHRYDCHEKKYELKTTKLTQVAIIEGVYSYNKHLTKYYDYLIFVDVTHEEQNRRLRERNSGAILEKFINEWIPKENLYFKTFNILGIADVII